MKKIAMAAGLVGFGACAGPTQFVGSPHVDGPTQCASVCRNWDMELVGMYTSGQFADGCICQVRGKQVSIIESGAAAVADASAVMVETRAAEEAKKKGP